MHRDIKLENIMMTDKKFSTSVAPKFIDFGLSKVLVPGETSMDPYGTLCYCSPEVVMGKPHTKATDIWSMGVVLYAMLTGRIPFATYDKKETSRNIIQSKINFN